MSKRYLSTTVKTSGATITTGSQTTFLRGRMVAGGGGGGGASGANRAAGGGSSGGYAEFAFDVRPSTVYDCEIGGAGTAGSSSGPTDGGVGGVTTITVGAVTVTANGGLGGSAQSGVLVPVLGGSSPAVSTNGTVNAGGEPGRSSTLGGATGYIAGYGGSGVFGAGGNCSIAAGTGKTGEGYGAGGGGGYGTNNGGPGTAGVIVYDEYA